MTTTSVPRRRFLQGSAAVVATVAVASVLDAPAIAAARRRRAAAGTGRLVVVYLRGGQDHLSTVVPYTEGAYYDARPDIAVPAASVRDLDGTFGFHPAMAGLHGLYGADRLSVAVATGNPAGNRSHFFAQDLSEYGSDAVPTDGQGWLGRHLAAVAGDLGPFRAVSLGPNVDASLRGFPALGLGAIVGFGLGGSTGTTAAMASMFSQSYSGDQPVETFGQQALTAAGQVGGLTGSTADDAVEQAFADVATLLDADLGAEVVTVNIGHWDTHAGMGAHDAGEMRDLLAHLDGALTGFQADLDARGQTDVTTVVMTEFGRRVAQNGSGGTDHGWASAMFVMGGAATGGVHGEWPGVGPADIGSRGDVPVGTDFRDVLGDVVSDVLGADPDTVFPGHTYQRVGVTAP